MANADVLIHSRVEGMVREHPIISGLGAAGLGLLLTGCASTAPSTAEQPSLGVSPSGNTLHMPDGWPTPGPLPNVDCGFGKPIQHQVAIRIASAWALQADTRCQLPFGQDYAGVYPDAGYSPTAIGRVYNGQWVEAGCATEGTPVNDPRNPAQYNATWYGITFVDQHDGGRVKYGLINGDNLGGATQNAAVGTPIPDLQRC